MQAVPHVCSKLNHFRVSACAATYQLVPKSHLDESRHTALPHNYFHDFPMNAWQKYNPVSTTRRVLLLLPMIPLLLRLEGDFAVLGIDLFDFAGSVLRKVFHLSERVGFRLPLPEGLILRQLNNIFNRYCSLTRGRHEFRDFMAAEATIGEAELAVERSVFQLARGDRGEEDAGNTAGDRPTALHTARRARATSRSVAAAH